MFNWYLKTIVNHFTLLFRLLIYIIFFKYNVNIITFTSPAVMVKFENVVSFSFFTYDNMSQENPTNGKIFFPFLKGF